MQNWPFEDLFWRNIYSSPLPIFYLDCLSFHKAVRVFYVFWILKANQIYYFQMFFPPLFFFIFLIISSVALKFSFWKVQFIYFAVVVHILGVLRTHCQIQGNKGLPLSSNGFIVLALIVKFLIHFELIYICDVRLGANCILSAYGIQLSQKHLFKKRLFFPHWVYLAPFSKINWSFQGNFITLSSVLLVYTFIHMHVSHCFDYCSSSLVSFEINKCESFNFILLFQNRFGYSGTLATPHEYESAFSFLHPLSF